MSAKTPYDIARARINLLTTFDLCEFYIPFLIGTDPAAQRRWTALERERREWLDSFGGAQPRVEEPDRRDGPAGR